MSWGSLFGAMMNTVAFGALWVVLGKVIEVITKAFNHAITVIPTFQDAVTGFNMMQWGWSGMMVIILLGIWFNYVANSSAASNQEV
jgi:type II secretory pathway component PulF